MATKLYGQRMTKNIFLIVLVITASYKNVHTMDLQPEIGDVMVERQLLDTVINAPVMRRIQKIDQHGPPFYLNLVPAAFSRFDHCVGVWQLVKEAGGSLKEQVAALLHDASHGPFSHLMDHVRQMAEQDHAYQDTIHLWFLEQMGIEDLLKNLENCGDWKLEDLNPDNPLYTRLEQPLPDLCADRIQYILHTGLMFSKITQEEVDYVREHLKFADDKWFLTDRKAALLIADLSLYFTKNFWGSVWNFVLYTYFAEAIAEGIKLNLINENDLHFGIDRQILSILEQAHSPYIQRRLSWSNAIHDSYQIVQDGSYDILFKPKFRGVNPWVMTTEGLRRLTNLDTAYADAFETTKSYCTEGIKVKFLKDPESDQ